jgi:protocatechuate 3,4-dioxygenase beta subunit
MSDSRRRFLRRASLSGVLFAVPGAFAQQLVLTPAQTLGPYYPDRIPLDRDNDLIIISDNITPAIGQVTWLSGRVLDQRGQPVRNALVEIWQADNNGAYIHSQSPIANRDANFQGYGRFLTGSTGEYLFRTVKPGLYPGRTRHIHFQITIPGGQRLVTQLYVEGDPLNATDGILNGIRDTAARNSVIVPFAAIPDSRIGELAARFDIILGFTPADPPAGRPSILSENGIVNGAGYQPGITAGAWLSIFGDNLSQTTRTWNPGTEIVNGKLPTSLDSVSVSINNKPAAVYYISPGQINVQAPAEDTVGPVQVTVTNANGTSDPIAAQVATLLPGFFLFPRNYVAAVHANGSYVGPAGLFEGLPTTPVRQGETVILFGTGFGPTNPAVSPGEVFQGAAPLSNFVTIRIGALPADVVFSGLSAAGLYQFNVKIPNVADGDHDVVATVGGARTQPLARIRVER